MNKKVSIVLVAIALVAMCALSVYATDRNTTVPETVDTDVSSSVFGQDTAFFEVSREMIAAVKASMDSASPRVDPVIASMLERSFANFEVSDEMRSHIKASKDSASPRYDECGATGHQYIPYVQINHARISPECTAYTRYYYECRNCNTSYATPVTTSYHPFGGATCQGMS